MSNTIINTDLGKDLEWKAYRYGYNEVKFLLTQNGSPFDITDYEFELVFREPGKSVEVLKLDEDGGITNGGATGVLTVSLTDSSISSDLKKDRYFFELRYIKDDKQFRFTQGYIELQKERNKANTNAEVSMPVTDSSGTTVNVTVLAFGSEFDISSLTPTQLQQLWAALAPYSLGLS